MAYTVDCKELSEHAGMQKEHPEEIDNLHQVQLVPIVRSMKETVKTQTNDATATLVDSQGKEFQDEGEHGWRSV